jgi:hypothetical protein
MWQLEWDFACAAGADPSVTADPAAFSATELLRLYRTRQLSPAGVTRAVLDRVEGFEPAVNAFCLVDPERAMQAARESEAVGSGVSLRACSMASPRRSRT